MAVPVAGTEQQGNQGEWRKRLGNLIADWKRLRRQIRQTPRDIMNNQGQVSPNPALKELREDRRHLVNQIRDIAMANDLVDFAIKKGFREDLLRSPSGNQTTPAAAEGSGKVPGVDAPLPGGDTGPSNRPGGNDRPRNRNRNKPKFEGDLLPGEQGKHYQLVRYNGRTYVVYKVDVGRKSVRVAWRIQPKDFDKHGFEEGVGRQITKAQMKNLQVFGTSDEIVRRKGGNKHPFKKWIEELDAIYGGTSILKNKETLGILVSGFLEREDPGITEAKLRKSKWYQKRTAYEREWEMVKTAAERQQVLKRTTEDVRLALDEIYGTVNWRNHVNEDQVENWATNIASGKWDEPRAALNSLINRLTRKAEKVEGTTAWQAKQEEAISAREFRNRPEEMFEQVRQQAINWLGYHGTPDRATMKKMAEDLAFARMSQAEFEQYLRKRKQELYPYLDPNESFMDRQSVFKSIAENLLGTTLSSRDKLLRDFAAKDESGQVLANGKQAMSAWDFEKLVRSDDRFWTSKTATEEGFGLYNMLNETFNGVAA